MANKYDTILVNIENLKRMDIGKTVFGSDVHMYRFNPTLTERQIDEFERIHAVCLPNDYRQFLSKVGNGGAGPSFGMPSLADYFNARHYGIEIASDFLSTPFPYCSNNPYTYSDETDDSLIREMTGTLTLCHHGCGHFDMLVLTGTEKGKVWFDSRCSDGGMGRISNNFLDWYCHWLDKSMQNFGQ